MKIASIKEDLVAQIDKLPYELQLRVLDLSLRGKRRNLLRFEGPIPTDDLQLMSEAIAKGCEKIYAYV